VFDYFNKNRTLQVEISTACNLDCTICLRQKQESLNKFLSLQQFKQIFDPDFFRYVGLHGWGEPLLNPRVFEMLGFARSKGVITNLTTNGTLLADKTDDILKSGLEEIAIGIYDSSLLSNVTPNIEEFVKEKRKRELKIPKVYFDITLYRENRDSVADMIRLASHIGVEAVIVHRLFNLYGIDSKAECLSEEDEKYLFRETRKIARSRRMDLYLPERHLLPCRIVKRSAFVTVDGKVTPCPYLFEEHIGDAYKEKVKVILNSRSYADFIRRMKQHSICSRCKW
jgi:MoaA/NifB/PqqE/SkfB family radical SAM enzyme